MPNGNARAAFANTALMILRNRLSERVWGCHGIYTLPITDRSPRLVRKRRLATGPVPPPGAVRDNSLLYVSSGSLAF